MSIKTDPQYGELVISQWLNLYQRKDLTAGDKIMRLYDLFVRVIVEVTDTSGLQFHTLFTRMAYIGTVVKMPPGLLYSAHVFRREVFTWIGEPEDMVAYRIQFIGRVGVDLFEALYGCKVGTSKKSMLADAEIYKQPESESSTHYDFRRVAAIRLDKEARLLYVLPEDTIVEVPIRYDVTGKNDIFKSTVSIIDKYFVYPVTLSLIDVEVQRDGTWVPSAIVLMPDYLIDVTAVAESLKKEGVQTLNYILRKFLPVPTNKAILTGNIVNYFLDELIANPKVGFKTLRDRLFKLSPLSFAAMDDTELLDFIQNLQRHFITLYYLANGGFQKQGIDPQESVLEPTFYSDRYGLQGRLDLFYAGDKNKGAIVELKSGKPFMPNKYGLNQSHYLQTLLYDLLVQSVYQNRLKPTSYILYSVDNDQPLRFAPVVKAQQYEALSARNELIGIEWQLAGLTEHSDLSENPIAAINVEDHPGLYGFILRDVMAFDKVYSHLSELEKRYFLAFMGMIAREHQLAKVGLAGREGLEGQASLWQKSPIQKEQSFELLKALVIESNHSDEEDPIIILKRTDATNPLANFRNGDIVVLYPTDEHIVTATAEQLIKCSIINIDPEYIHLRLRAKQTNNVFFDKYRLWNIEQDLLDSSFMGLSRGLFEWASSPKDVRRKIICLEEPRKPVIQSITLPDDLTAEQAEICKNIICSNDYFLLWGPPGTGKTSKMLHHIVRYLLSNSKERLLLIAYTNRAVDEICHAIESIAPEIRQQYLRIGSRYGAAPEYRDRLLDQLAQQCASRKDLLELLDNQKIVVGTLASLQGKPDLFDLMHFDRLIVDEASQILEPSMAGMMVKFEKVLLIGDHQQLPAVVAQNAKYTKIESPELHEIGLVDMRDSLFERLFRNAVAKNWDWAYARLSHQGRMHADIMAFPNQLFYQSGLKILPLEVESHFQLTPLNRLLTPGRSPAWSHKLAVRRVNFIPTPADEEHILGKVNQAEADMVVDIVRFFQANANQGKADIGIITPYRAQIATILHALQRADLVNECIQVDTVERFQGGAKDIIIISLCANYVHQLQSLVSLSSEGIDRKFNVALTRARKHLVVLGNPEVLQKDDRYRAFMAAYRV